MSLAINLIETDILVDQIALNEIHRTHATTTQHAARFNIHPGIDQYLQYRLVLINDQGLVGIGQIDIEGTILRLRHGS